MKTFAVVLCGSGHLDGSEIRESVAVLWGLSKAGASFQCFAPDLPQADVMNHLKGEPAGEKTRNMLEEAARIARGKIEPLSNLDDSRFSGIVMPGGFGAAKNLSTFAAKGAQASVLPELKTALHKFYSAKKPIGAVCIAPAIVALAFPGKKFELTVGEPCEASQEIEKLGHRHVPHPVTQCHVDRENRIVTAPAYMYGSAPLHEVFLGIDHLCQEVFRIAS